jgi:PAS domain S-box-containing protein
MKTTAFQSPTFIPSSVLLEAVLNSSGDAIISIDPAGVIDSWNPAAQRIFEYSDIEILGQPASLLFDTSYNKLLQAMSDAEPGKYTKTVCKKKDGTIFNPAISVSVIGSAGAKVGFLAIVRELDTIAVENEDATETLLQSIFENVEQGFVLLDGDCIIRMLNSKACESIVLNREEKEVKAGASIFEFVEESRKDFFRKITDQVLEGKSIRYERSFNSEDGKTYWFQFALNPVKKQQAVTGICITGSNITKRKISEQIAEQNEKRFRGLVENSGDVVSILSIDSKVNYISPSILKIFGYTEEQALGIDFLSLVHPKDLATIKAVWEKTVAAPGVPFYNNVYRLRHATGAWRWIDGTITNMLHNTVIEGIVHNFRDINDAVAARDALRLSEERYRYLFNNNPEPMWIYDPHTLRFLEVNNAAVEKYGYTRDEFLQLGLVTVYGDIDASPASDAIVTTGDRLYSGNGAWKHITKTNQLLDVIISSHSFGHNGIDAILVLATDITEKNTADRLLLKAYAEKNNILESITDGFFAVDKSWVITYLNKEAESMLGMPREILIGKNMWEVYDPQLTSTFYNQYSKAVNERIQVSFEEFFQPLNVWIEITAYPSDEGLAVYFKNITEKKLIHESMRTTKERYEMVAKATNDAIYEWDILANMTYWGEGFTTLFGHPRSEGGMPPESWEDNLHPDDKDGLLAIGLDAFKNRRTSLTRELRFRCADGNYKTVFDKLNIVYDTDCKPVKIVGAMQDISDRKNSEIAILELNKELKRRAEELVASNEELERFAYVASHDLQEPLRMVGSFLQLLQKKYNEQLDETAQQYIGFAVDGSLRMKKLIQDLLDYARVGTNKEEKIKVDMNVIVSTAIKNIPVGNIVPVLKIKTLPVIIANKIQIEQLLQNLLSNAFKYNTSEAPAIEVGCEETGDEWQFFVKDDGIGIDKKFRDKVFVIFQRLHNKSQFPGTGIGLAICKKIVERHGGKIWIESEPGQGSTFYFTIKK